GTAGKNGNSTIVSWDNKILTAYGGVRGGHNRNGAGSGNSGGGSGGGGTVTENGSELGTGWEFVKGGDGNNGHDRDCGGRFGGAAATIIKPNYTIGGSANGKGGTGGCGGKGNGEDGGSGEARIVVTWWE
ncbi:MAG: hypothetical protein FWH22_06555, partial [Fibromonadales bacterium]|nr:hypothetical protein [Fibromonadales bacterium]